MNRERERKLRVVFKQKEEGEEEASIRQWLRNTLPLALKAGRERRQWHCFPALKKRRKTFHTQQYRRRRRLLQDEATAGMCLCAQKAKRRTNFWACTISTYAHTKYKRKREREGKKAQGLDCRSMCVGAQAFSQSGAFLLWRSQKPVQRCL